MFIQETQKLIKAIREDEENNLDKEILDNLLVDELNESSVVIVLGGQMKVVGEREEYPRGRKQLTQILSANQQNYLVYKSKEILQVEQVELI